ncbi:MAG: hypothetical protein UV73_C0002G0049 [Candidatus Gottesmanbacteria bacterium GW2011_GWA2_43_14]|uniref:FecR protein domain-containing protein n=1 Tax=Candidatus Gottesmanbacteria bacterium GW2011_GWA2_43_14 TaxID=1618443 RepID=A0A0G1DKF3_9BACT|nr:MAG: hypothetical protein UV73_C0002G0049 [Candidatus Gottesmanbacteria bacterium GW2011_GWA2_43_14]
MKIRRNLITIIGLILFFVFIWPIRYVHAYPPPQKVTATSDTVQVWNFTLVYHLEFWNVGALDPSGQYSQVSGRAECTSNCNGYGGDEFTGTFSGGPNGEFIIGDLSFNLIRGTYTTVFDTLRVDFTVDNPEAFDGSWNIETDFLPKQGVDGGLVKGTAQFSRNNGETYEDIPSDGPINIREGDVIKTGPNSRFIIKYPDGSILKIKSNTKVTMLFQGVQIVFGETFFNLKKQGKTFQVETYLTVAGVLGTSFGVSHLEETNETKFDVMEGSVEVTLPDNGKLPLSPGDRYTVNGDGYEVTEFNYTDVLKEETELIETELAQAELNDNGNLNTDESDTQGYKENGTKTTPFRITPTILIFIGVLIFAVIVVILLKRKK